MPRYTGRSEVERLRQSLDASFDRADTYARTIPDLELHADLARYLCTRTAGFVEKAVATMAIAHANGRSSPTVTRYVEKRTQRLQNLNKKKLLDFVRDFSPVWALELEQSFQDEMETVNTVVLNRHLIAHGGNSDISLVRMREYRDSVYVVVDWIVRTFEA